MVTALVMAGGKGTRMGTRTEKPLIELGGDPMIKRVIDALSASKKVSEIIIATSPNTPKTHEFVQKMRI